MFDIGFQELIIIFVVAFLVVGPERLPEFSTKLGKWVQQVRNGIEEAKKNIKGDFREIASGSGDNAVSRDVDTVTVPGFEGGDPGGDAVFAGKGEA